MQRDEPASATLYLVGTPIGHMGDLSPRARHLLAHVDLIACEDTRRSGPLLSGLGAVGQRLSFHQHNTRTRLPHLLDKLDQGMSLAVISDAGLPGISDPGEDLAAAARQAGHEVICVPGPCAATTALVSSGLPCGRFCFEGFLPPRGRERRERLEELACDKRTTVLYEAPHRLLALLQDLADLCGAERPLQVARELTKRHEEQIGPTVHAALQHFLQHPPQGECTLVLGGMPPVASQELGDDDLLKRLKDSMADGCTASDAAKQVAQTTGRSRRELYALLHRRATD